MKNYFKVDQEVWYLDQELKIHEGIVSEIRSKQILKVYVKFKSFNGQFTLDGQISEDGHICLFQTKPIITENVQIFEERPAYFWDGLAECWIFDVVAEIDKCGNAVSKSRNGWHSKWQYEKPELI